MTNGMDLGWLRSCWGEDYRESVAGILTPERTAAEVSFLVRTTGLQPPTRVLDLACGHGRHVVELARRGFDVTGVDLNTGALALAREALPTGTSATFLDADYASPPAGPFGLALCLFGSFGFGNDDANARTLHAWCRCLCDGGFVVLELWHRDCIVSDFRPERTWRASPQLVVHEQREFDARTGRLRVDHEYVHAGGQRTRHAMDVRLYTTDEVRSMLEAGGVRITAVFGSLRGDPDDASARSLVVFGRKAVTGADRLGCQLGHEQLPPS